VLIHLRVLFAGLLIWTIIARGVDPRADCFFTVLTVVCALVNAVLALLARRRR
jgi:hypothetical protein